MSALVVLLCCDVCELYCMCVLCHVLPLFVCVYVFYAVFVYCMCGYFVIPPLHLTPHLQLTIVGSNCLYRTIT